MRRGRAAPAVLSAVEQQRASAFPPHDRRPRARRPRAADNRARGAEQAVRHARACGPRPRQPRVLRGPALLRQEHRGRPGPAWRARRRHRRQPAEASGGRDRHQRVGKGGALHPVLRCVRDPDHLLRRRAGLPAGPRPGARRHHPPRREAALRVRGGDSAEADRHHAQGLRRSLLRHVAQADGRGPEPGVADRRDRCDGTRRRREHHLQARPHQRL